MGHSRDHIICEHNQKALAEAKADMIEWAMGEHDYREGSFDSRFREVSIVFEDEQAAYRYCYNQICCKLVATFKAPKKDITKDKKYKELSKKVDEAYEHFNEVKNYNYLASLKSESIKCDFCGGRLPVKYIVSHTRYPVTQCPICDNTILPTSLVTKRVNANKRLEKAQLELSEYKVKFGSDDTKLMYMVYADEHN